MANFHLQIVTPDRMIYDGEAQQVVVRTVNGEVCILSRHIDYAAPLSIGEARVTDGEGNVRAAACSGGLLSVSGDTTRLLATTFEWAEDIDLARAESAKEKTEQTLAKTASKDMAYAALEAKLKRALTRIKVKNHK